MTPSIRTVLAATVALVLATPAAATTVHEGDLAGGSFSGAFDAPTTLGAGVTGVSGTGASGQFDFFVFTGLPTGAQTLTFDFAAPEVIGYSYSAGGSIKTSTTPFRWGWDGDDAGTFHLGHGQPTATRTLLLGEGFAGTLHVGLYFTYGSNISYTVSTDAIEPGVVPLPGAGLLLLTGLAGAVAVGRHRRG